MVTDLEEADVAIESDDSSTNLLSVFTDENSSSLDILKCSSLSFFASNKKILNLCRVVLTSQFLSYRSDYIDVPYLPNILYFNYKTSCIFFSSHILIHPSILENNTFIRIIQK